MTRPGEIHKLRTLIVEDNTFFRQSFKERLQTFFPLMVVQEAATASEALQEVTAFCPELIFMDIRLPDGNGLELTKKIKANDPNVAVIILSNYDDLVKSLKSRLSCESRSPELLELTGFPLSRECRKWDKKDFLRSHQL